MTNHEQRRKFAVKLVLSLLAGLSAAALLGLGLLCWARSTYYGSHGFLGGFELWHPFAALGAILAAFTAGFALTWVRR